MRLPRVRTPEEDDIRLFDFTIRTRAPARAEYRRQTGDAWRVSSPVATIDVVAADHRPHEFLCGVIKLVRGLRATEHSKRARTVRIHLPPDSRGRQIQSLVPAGGAVTSVLAH
jgi:hypothetical protein